MRSHNKARLIDITEKNLDPAKSYSIGLDGRLNDIPKEDNEKQDDAGQAVVELQPTPLFASAIQQEQQDAVQAVEYSKDETIAVVTKKKDGKFKKSTSK